MFYSFKLLPLFESGEVSQVRETFSAKSLSFMIYEYFADIVQNVSMNEHSKLEGISKSNPTTQENLEVQVLNKGDDSQDLVKYLLVQLMDNEGNL